MKKTNVTPIKPEFVPEANHIVSFMHCGLCLGERPEDQSPQEWGRLEAGWTKQGIQVWCKRHDVNVLHIDFEGVKHRATQNRLLRPGEKKP